MSYDEQQARSSRVVVDTPSERREVVESHSIRNPDSSGISAGMVGVLVVVAIALITMLVLFWMSNQQTVDPNANTVAAQQQQPATTVVQQPAQQPPVIIQQQPAPPAPVVISPGTVSGGTATENPNDDSTIQTKIDKQLADDPALSSLGITATVINGKVTLLGTVKTEAMKTQVERTVRKVRGVKDIDNQISVIP